MKSIKPVLSFVLISFVVILINIGFALGKGNTQSNQETPDIQGPFISDPIYPSEVGDLRDLPQITEDVSQGGVIPLKYTPGTKPKGPSTVIAGWKDPIAQTMEGEGSMPAPLSNFPGISYGDLGQHYFPPDTNGDVGPDYYIQTVNVSFTIYDKLSGNEIVHKSFNELFSGSPSPCSYLNSGDPVVVYDRFADRWLISDFALPSSGPFYECIAVSQSGNPVSGGWWLYPVLISTNAINDYPKVGVWPDAYYFAFNMFTEPGDGWGGVQVWAMDRTKMLAGQPITTVHFVLDASSGYSSLMPSHALSQPPTGSPNYFASVSPPNQLQIWKFHVNFASPTSSTFTGPTILPAANFAIAASVPQPGTSQVLDSLSFRPMMQLIYRKIGDVESLWLNHSVASRGVSGIRWYEVRNPGGTPTLFQQGTYNPDLNHRWMGSLAVDQDGNMAVGYSVSSSSMYPAIRYAGRQAGEIPGLLTQAESVLTQGKGSQTVSNRWGDYSSMSVDVVDDCTFWYTTEYLGTSGPTWLTRIGSFKFPSCGQDKGSISGYVRNSVTSQVIPGIKVIATSSAQTKVVQTDASGFYTITLLGGSYNLTGGPLSPGYPISVTINSVEVSVGSNTTQDLSLTPKPYLIAGVSTVDDNVPYANHNGYPEPGERGLRFTLNLTNTGAITATDITARLTSTTPGVIIETADVSYPDIPPGTTRVDPNPFVFSLKTDLVCGTDLAFRVTVNTSDASYNIDLTLNASILLPRENILFNDVETPQTGWLTGGFKNTWITTTAAYKSPTHSWSDSPGQYADNTDSYMQSPVIDLTGKRHVRIGGWFKYALEAGYDYVYLEYSTNDGASWNTIPLLTLNGTQATWVNQIVDTPMLDGESNVVFRYRIITDQGVVMDGVYIDDIALSHEPFACYYVPTLPNIPILELPYNNSKKTNPVTFQWSDSGNGVPPTGYVFTVEGVTTITFTSPISTTTITLPLGLHQWNVVALNGEWESPTSEAWNFEVLDFKTGVPGTPILLAPINGSQASGQSILFHWTDSGTGGTPLGYVFSLDGTAVITFTNPVNDYPFWLTPGSHTWTVRAYNGDGHSDDAESWIINEPFWSFLPFITNK